MSEPATPARFPARLFDGESAEAHAVTAEPLGFGVRVVRADGREDVWPYAECVLVRGEARGEDVQLERRADPVEVLVVRDGSFLAEMRAALPPATRLARLGGPSFGLRAVLWIALAAAALLFGLYRWGLPGLAEFAAARVPPAWEAKLGEAVVEELAPAERRIENPAVTGPVIAIHARLRDGTPAAESRVVVARLPMVNAFAAPGGTIVVTTPLLDALHSPEELAAVLAHELAHVERRHALRGLIQQLSLQALLGLIAGDASALGEGLRVAGRLGSLSYSRADELAADDGAETLLERAGVGGAALADALESLGRASPRSGGLDFLSTHPAPERARGGFARERAAGRATPDGEPLVGPEAWRAMQEAARASGGDAGALTR